MEENGEVEMFEIYFTYCLIDTYFGKKYQSLLAKTLYSISLPSLGSSFKKHKNYHLNSQHYIPQTEHSLIRSNYLFSPEA